MFIHINIIYYHQTFITIISMIEDKKTWLSSLEQEKIVHFSSFPYISVHFGYLRGFYNDLHRILQKSTEFYRIIYKIT